MDSTTTRKRTTRTTASTKRRATPAPEPVVDDDFEDEEVLEVEEEEEDKGRPRARTTRTRAAQPIAAPDSSAPARQPYPLQSDPSSAGPYRIIALLSGAVAVLLLGALIFSLLQLQDKSHTISTQNQASALRQSAISAADTYGVYLSSYNYNNLTSSNSTWAEVQSNSTAAFATKFNQTKSTLSTLIKDYHATASGKVVAAGLTSVSSSQAVVLLFIDQTVTNSATKPNTQIEPLRVQLSMMRQNGKWLISDLGVPS